MQQPFLSVSVTMDYNSNGETPRSSVFNRLGPRGSARGRRVRAEDSRSFRVGSLPVQGLGSPLYDGSDQSPTAGPAAWGQEGDSRFVGAPDFSQAYEEGAYNPVRQPFSHAVPPPLNSPRNISIIDQIPHEEYPHEKTYDSVSNGSTRIVHQTATGDIIITARGKGERFLSSDSSAQSTSSYPYRSGDGSLANHDFAPVQPAFWIDPAKASQALRSSEPKYRTVADRKFSSTQPRPQQPQSPYRPPPPTSSGCHHPEMFDTFRNPFLPALESLEEHGPAARYEAPTDYNDRKLHFDTRSPKHSGDSYVPSYSRLRRQDCHPTHRERSPSPPLPLSKKFSAEPSPPKCYTKPIVSKHTSSNSKKTATQPMTEKNETVKRSPNTVRGTRKEGGIKQAERKAIKPTSKLAASSASSTTTSNPLATNHTTLPDDSGESVISMYIDEDSGLYKQDWGEERNDDSHTRNMHPVVSSTQKEEHQTKETEKEAKFTLGLSSQKAQAKQEKETLQTQEPDIEEKREQREAQERQQKEEERKKQQERKAALARKKRTRAYNTRTGSCGTGCQS